MPELFDAIKRFAPGLDSLNDAEHIEEILRPRLRTLHYEVEHLILEGDDLRWDRHVTRLVLGEVPLEQLRSLLFR